MSDLKLFRIEAGKALELSGSSVALERQLQRTIEVNMETLFGVRFLASEYSTGAKHRGRIDSLGIDETGSPVIFEYKRSRDENVINERRHACTLAERRHRRCQQPTRWPHSTAPH
ncbi:hypothetical protein ORV05_02540 [Amycolatopsis cynarae]|uniref:DUF91 domain-containing protein n=1 Tax=Amycolatopsis cynarae TaxID=2995223 RepID=A0ABY7B638_9PSEU|nr:hypothetical protein [Amycolatopsis sp. HUAS 11-8]WAL66712.1 hypothetical protein ORV05_02540 [Amycolatopsis sp. HUAS 11-8]